MCTISWQVRREGYDLFFTRDEQRSRAPAEAPRTHETAEGIHCLAPTDPVGGGTWIFINKYGLAGALLNAYELDGETPAIEASESRGQLLRSLASADRVETFAIDLADRIGRHAYPPCYLFAISPDGVVGLWLWNARALAAQPVPDLQFFTTSSFRPTEVGAYRTEHFKNQVGQPPHSPEALENFHRNEESRLSAFDVRMSRPDACSVSFTHICCRHDGRTMHYAPRDGDAAFSLPSETILAEREPA